MNKRQIILLWIGLLATTPAFAEQPAAAAADQSTQETAKIRNEVNTQAAIIEAIDDMKSRDADQGAAQTRYTQTVDAAKAEHERALSKCQSLVGDTKAACKERADAELDTAKAAAQKALEAHTSAQP